MSQKETIRNLIDATKEKGTRLTTGALIVLSGLGLAGCAETEAKPVPSATQTTEAPTPTPTETANETPTPSSSETEGTESNIIVDYTLFDDWDEMGRRAEVVPGTVHNPAFNDSQEYAVNQLFIANGLEDWNDLRQEPGWAGTQIMEYFAPRFELAWRLNNDTTNDRNGEVALKIMETLTTDGPAREKIKNIFNTYRGSSLGVFQPPDLSYITRQTGLVTDASGIVVEYKEKDVAFPDQFVYPKMIFDWTDRADFRLRDWIDRNVGEDTQVNWGAGAPRDVNPR